MKCTQALFLGLVLGSTHLAFGEQNSFQGVDTTDNEMIVGGSTVASSDPVASTTVLIVGNTGPKQQYICSGSIIAEDIVITAAHCVEAQPQNMRVVFATSIGPKLDPSKVQPISGYLANPNFVGANGGEISGDDAGDVALIRLSGSLPAGYHAASVLDDMNLAKGESTLLAGYGITSAKTQKGAGTLRKVTTTILGDVGKTEAAVDMSHNKGMCNGDSGGPAFVQRNGQSLLWGVTSRADQDCTKAGIYTQIAPYLSWIASAEAQLRAGQ